MSLSSRSLAYTIALVLVLCGISPAWAAVSCSALASSTGNSITDATSYATDSVTLTAGRLYVLFVSSNVTTGPGNAATATSTGATWVQIDAQGFDNDDSTGRKRITALRTMVASNQTGAVTIGFSGQTQLAAGWSITECTGVDTSGTNGSGAVVASNKNVVQGLTSITLTFAAFSHADNRPIAGFASAATTTTATPDWTELSEGTTADGGYLDTVWLDSVADTTASIGGTGANDYGGIGVEVKAATAASCAGRIALLGVGC